MSIRRLNTEDAAAYRALRLRALREHPTAFTSDWASESTRPLAVAQERLASDAVALWGAFDAGDTLVGMVGLECPARAQQRHKGTVVAMYVAREAAGQGLGCLLLQVLMAHARAIGQIDLVLTVTEGNDHAIALYRRAGFVAFGTEPRAIVVDGRPWGKVHMHRQLDAPGA